MRGTQAAAVKRSSRTKVSYGDQSAQLKEIRAFDPDHARWSFSSQQATLRRLTLAFAAFFRRVRAGETPGYPRFKGAGWFDTVTWPVDGDGCRWDSQPEHPTTTFVRLQGIGHVRVHQHRPVAGGVRTISVKREGDRWYVVLSCDDVPVRPLEPAGAVVGVDMGVASLVTTAKGRHVGNPRFLERSAEKLADAQRDLARKKRGSTRLRRAAALVAAQHRAVARQRLDLANKTALELVRDHDLIAVEKLTIKGMVRRAKAKPDRPGAFLANGQAAKSGLNRSIHTPQRCAACGHVAEENRPSQAVFACVTCGHTAHADENAAVNILRAGLVLQTDAQAA
ncbi:RNA-guided endonuclease InsQ/TnpB family protein [Frankia tisae]|uniref:RNA-guided endonuclease InsQ/TnpB family protein n=1 Tax=Frankia tisae TaxID=2950104 RepID=UPI0021C08179|nr:transposase [Frankia tisae]